MDNVYVLDSFALLAHFEGEKRGGKVTELLEKAAEGKRLLYMSVITLGEIYYLTLRERDGKEAEDVLMMVGQLPITVEDADKALTVEAAKLKARYPVAYADCFAAALALEKEGRLVTGDPEFKHFEKDVKIVWI